MNKLKRILGIFWLIIGPAVILILVAGAWQNIDINGVSDINKPVPWAIIISIFTPIAIGLMIFGWYAWKGEFDDQ